METLYLNVLKDAADAVSRSRTQTEALENAVALVAGQLDFDVCSIYLYDQEAGVLRLAASHGLNPEAVGRVEMSLDEGLSGEVGQTLRPVLTTDASEHPRYKFFPETGEESLATYAGFPLVRDDTLVGVLTVQSRRRREFHRNEVVMLETLARLVVSVIHVSQVVRTGRVEREVTCLSGLGTSPGIAMARAVVVGDVTELPLPAQAFRGAPEEIAALDDAIAASSAEADEVIASLHADGVSTEATEIIAAHKALLGDPQLRNDVERLIGEGQGAAHAVDQAIAPLVERLQQLPAMAEKAHDLADVRAQLLRHLGALEDAPVGPTGEPAVVMASTLTPAQTALLDASSVVAIVTEHGSEMSHMSILARSRGIPAVVGVTDLLSTARRGDQLLVDGDNGFVFIAPDDRTVQKYFDRRDERAMTTRLLVDELERRAAELDGAWDERLQVNLGVGSDELRVANEAGVRAVGLLRTEFFFLHQARWPTVEEQLAYLAPVVGSFDEVTIRLLDIGGDKQLPYLGHEVEPNPILGYRSLRLLLDHPQVYVDQLDAIFAAALAHPGSRVRVMVPMVGTRWEMQAARELFDERRAAVAPDRELPFGMMIEVPAVLYQLEDYLPLVDFFAVGTNDLVQYLLAVDRDNERVRSRYVPYHPAVLRALASIVDRIGPHGHTPSVCGEMAGQAETALALLAIGYRRLSVSIEALPRMRYLLQNLEGVDLAPLRRELLALETEDSVQYTLRDHIRRYAPLVARMG